MTLSEFEDYFFGLEPLQYLQIINKVELNYDMFTHKLESVCGFNLYCQSEEVLKIIGSHVHFKSGSISKTVPDRAVTCNYRPLTASKLQLIKKQ